jgi:glutamate 5-kinase
MEAQKPIVVKVGTNVVTRKNEVSGSSDILDLNVMTDLANQITRVVADTRRRVILVSSGAVAAGKSRMKLGNEVERITAKQAYAHVGQPLLMSAYDSIFSSLDPRLIPGQGLFTSRNFDNLNERENMVKVFNALPLNVVPVINENDVIANEELTFGDNDQLACRMAQLVRAELLILLTDVDGVFDKNPSEFDDAKLLQQIRTADIEGGFLESCGVGKSTNGTGGMKSKLMAAQRAAEDGITAFIANGKSGNNLLNIALRGEGGTRIR